MTHIFSATEQLKGSKASKASAKSERKLRKMAINAAKFEVWAEQAGKVFAVWVSTPFGQLVTGYFIVNLLEQNGLLNTADASLLKGGDLALSLLGAAGGLSGLAGIASQFLAGKAK
jgi:hypothetical protein